ncbi:Phospholipid-transporting ATPase [Vigna angularis]|uniref:Phospholipid-transporting ATPase n=1 Tax=Phaseolus angularis TaxID=3914 RepID=A0A8T0KYQ8_PHAAN|nr:Phospholipid-transporting ATPase [Vigna angularis]
MSSDETLLLESDPRPVIVHRRGKSGSRTYLCGHGSFSSSVFEAAIADIGDLDVKERNKEVLSSDCSFQTASFSNSNISDRCAVESKFPWQFPLECPTRERRRSASWGAMELHGADNRSVPFEISGASSHVQDRLNSKSQRIRHRSVQFDDPAFQEDGARLIYINDPRKTNDKYEFTGNEIRTSRYTFVTFLPKNLFIQFHRVAYLYFLAIAALNQLPPLAVFGRTVSLFPLLFVLCVTAIKDGYEDWRRHRSDRNENNRESLVLQSGDFRSKKWKKVQAGEVVKIFADETIPADMVLLGTSDQSGLAYIQTMNLDGESNLKTRYARQETASVVTSESCDVFGVIRCEQPNRNIYEFTANMEFNGLKFSLSQSNIVLRGCQLKNTDWIIGVVVYAGQETKAMLNSAASPSKRSRLESYMNRETLWLSVFLFIMCLVVAIGMCLWLVRHKNQLDTLPYYRKIYFTNGPDNGKKYKYYGIPMEAFFSFLSSVIVFQIMIPISLYITMELVRLGQSYFMIEDRDMYDASSGSRFQCRSLNINEDLGQIRYIFSDKTGTLTENKMEFKRASVHGKNYGSSLHAVDHTAVDVTPKRRWKLKSEPVVDSELMMMLRENSNREERVSGHEFFLTLAACNTVIPILGDGGFSRHGTNELKDDIRCIDYQGESPDEQALVSAASAYGYTLFERTSGHIVIDVNGEKLRLDVLGLHEFDSVRKRMSVVIRFPDNAVKVLVKGADTSMFSILENGSESNNNILHTTQSHLNEYSSQGLRTLVIGSRDLSDAELEEWQSCYEEASTSLTDRATKLRQTAALIESNLKLLGATGIEDKLQEGVPEAIEALRQAGIKVWVLTGDKQETAISIGLSCKLLSGDMQQIIINGTSEVECRSLLADAKAKYGVKSSSGGRRSSKHKTNAGHGDLDIPNGANDVSMIQMADVGVGICGQEGRQAVMASDFAMGQFQFLKKLLLVHGHWNYQRVGYLVLYNFYRNAVFVLMLFWYILCTAFSTTSALTDWSSVFYSVIYTSVPTIIVGIQDKDLSHRTLLQYPKLYGSGHRQEAYNMQLFWITMIDTVWQSLVLFYIPLFTYKDSSIDIWSMGSLWTIAVVILVNVHLGMDINRWVLITHVAIWGSIIITYGCMVILDSIPVFPNYWTIYHLARSPTYWITILLIIIVALLPRFICKVVYQIFWPSDIQIAREADLMRKRHATLRPRLQVSS